jgi:hypothetical protein
LRRDHLTLVVTRQIDRIEPRTPAVAARIALRLPEVGEHAAIGRPGRTLDQEALSQEPFARAVRLADADIEGAAIEFCESDEVAAR